MLALVEIVDNRGFRSLDEHVRVHVGIVRCAVELESSISCQSRHTFWGRAVVDPFAAEPVVCVPRRGRLARHDLQDGLLLFLQLEPDKKKGIKRLTVASACTPSHLPQDSQKRLRDIDMEFGR